MTIPHMIDSYQAHPRNVAYLMERACVAAADSEAFEPGLSRVRARDAHTLVRMARERLEAGLA